MRSFGLGYTSFMRLFTSFHRLHQHNSTLEAKAKLSEESVHDRTDEGQEYVSQFGFHVKTCCGYIEQDNDWSDSWEVCSGNKKVVLKSVMFVL